ncbi:MAG: hypothetical protein ACXAHE_19120 [Roseburia sp. 1XD42-69]
METGGFHLFGNSCTTIITTETDNYPVIEDEPGKLEVVDNTDLMSGIGHGIANGLLLCAGVVLFAGATAATGGAALLLGGCVLGGMSFGVSAATDGMVESDRETGNDRSWGDFALGLAAPVAGLAAGMDAAAVIGPSAFTTTVVPAIITGGGYGLAGATALYVENDIRARNGGYNLLLDKVFENNTDRYEECGMILMLGNNVYMEYGAMNMNRMPGGDSKQSLGNNQSVQKLKAQNSSSGNGGGNTGSGGGTSSSGSGGQLQVGVQFGTKSEPHYEKTNGKCESTADFMVDIENVNGKFYTDKDTIDKIGRIEARGEDFSLLYKKIMSSRPSSEGGTSIVYKYSDELRTKYLIHEVTDARGYIIHRDFDAVRISSEQLINKRH